MAGWWGVMLVSGLLTMSVQGDKLTKQVTFSDVKASQEYQPSGTGGTRSPPATPHHLKHLTACLIQNGRQGLEIG